jgi:hypothetical protein
MSDDHIQEAMLLLIEASGHWNAFDGPSIARDLRQNRKLWRSAILVGPGERIYLDSSSGDFVRSERDFSPHRGLPDTLYGFDVLQLMPSSGAQDELETLAKSWNADSLQWIGLPQATTAIEDDEAYGESGGDRQRVLLELWWD